MKKIIFFLLVFDIAFFCLKSQELDYSYSKEKVYVHTSHVFYKPGETLFFKIYVMQAKDHTPTQLSNVVYAEILNPSGNVLKKMNYRVDDGYAEGSFDFEENAVGGIYKIRVYTTWMRNENENSFFVKELTLQNVLAPRVLMKLDFPEKGYGPGSEVKAAFSMRNLNDQPIRNYKGKFTVSIAGEIIITDHFSTNAEGKSQIKFDLPKELKSTDGLLNVTIDYDSFTESISRSIPIVLNKIDLQFMPEGGTMIQGLPVNIAFKALNEKGKAADIKAELWDDAGNKISTFESFHFGMGKFEFIPVFGRSYKVRIISPANISQQFNLPSATSHGIVLKMSKSSGLIKLTIHSTDARNIIIKGNTRNQEFYFKEMSLQKGENILEIDTKPFPAGIAEFTIYASNNLPLAERLVFLNESNLLHVKINADKPTYLPREKVKLTISSFDTNGKPVPSNFSLGVVDDKLWSFADDKQDHLISWLLLSSELHGKIEEPQFYFKKEEQKAVPALDLLMLTHGYRYFDYIEYVQETKKLKYTPDQENILSGMIVNKNGKPIQANIFFVDSSYGGKAINFKTSDDGLFYFSQLNPGQRYYIFAQAIDKKENPVINIIHSGIGNNPLKSVSLKPIISREEEKKDPRTGVLTPVKIPKEKDKLRDISLPNNLTIPFGSKSLGEVVVIGYGSMRKAYQVGSIVSVQTRELQAVGNLNFALQGRASGVYIQRNVNPFLDDKVVIRGIGSFSHANSPLFVVDGMPMETINLNSIHPNDIESVTILKDGSATSQFGSKGANGVILIETRFLRNERLRFDLTSKQRYISHSILISNVHYSVAKRFYAPEYHSTNTAERIDFRETIYWNPVVQTNSHGLAEIEFYNSDASTTFRVIAEGIGYNGLPGRTEMTYAAQNPIAVDAKIPPYLTVGDKALIPLIIKNNRNEDLNISIAIELPENLTVGNFDHDVVLKPGSSEKISVPVEALASMNGNIRFGISSPFGYETLVLPISANEKGFPVIETFSGNKNAEHKFTIHKMVPGSLKTELKLFKNLEGQLLNGIESMLREPYGCFEQTSSTTYPNIFVLKYLRESGKSNPEIEKKALDYITKGYNKLIGFETALNGFEWFGKTPPHEALTAYGLLEFTEMQEFIDVDKQMLARTKKFLLDRRDGNGGFKLASGGYDRFASVPNAIANIYIVYALTQAGIGKEIQMEYEAGVKNALKTNDAYQLAMMAIAANNMKDLKSYEQLMNVLNSNYKKSGLISETSVVNSRAGSLKVETLSLYAIALMRSPSVDIGLVGDIISTVLSEKNYYGYGSTQATVLALQAIVAYSKITGRVKDDLQIEFAMNDRKYTDAENFKAAVKEDKNLFTVKYADTIQKIPYNLEVSYNTLTPPDNEKAELRLNFSLNNNQPKIGETVRLTVNVENTKSILQPMAIAKIGIPAGLSTQPWQLKEIMEKNEIAYYEIFDNYLVFYWMGFAANETKTIQLDLKAEIAGSYKGKASNAYLYYTPEYKNWKDGLEVEVRE